MPEADLRLLMEAAKAAGEIATGFSAKTVRRWEKPYDAGPVTEADLAVNAMLKDKLRTARPGYGWLSEESEDHAERLTRERIFIIDPIDGTRSFIEGAQTWSHALAVAEKGTVLAAVVYLPLMGKLYSAAAGQGAFLNGAPIRVTERDALAGASVLAAKPNFRPEFWPGGVPQLVHHYRPSLAYRQSLVAEGKYDLMLTLRRSWEWDIAAGDLILREAGAMTSDRRGKPLRFNNPDPFLDGVLAANPALHGQVAAALGA